MSGRDFAVVRAALAALPDCCRYHGDRLDPDHLSYGREACCDTGVPAQRRRVAEKALQRLEQRADNAEERLGLCRRALITDGYFTPAEVGPDIAPRITELASHLRTRAEKAEADRDRLATALREVLAVFATVTITGDRAPIAHWTPSPVHPEDFNRWRAALDYVQSSTQSTEQDDPPVRCWHTEPGSPCDWDVCRQPERLTAGDRGTDPARVTPHKEPS